MNRKEKFKTPKHKKKAKAKKKDKAKKKRNCSAAAIVKAAYQSSMQA